MEDEPEVVSYRNRSATQHDSLTELIAALEAAKTLGMRNVCVTTLAVPSSGSLPACFRYHLDVDALSPRDVLARSASLRSTRSA